MKRVILLITIMCLLLSGCSTLLDGNYHSVNIHKELHSPSNDQMTAVASYTALCRFLTTMVESGIKSATLSVAHYDQLTIAQDMRQAIQLVTGTHPIGAFAVDTISFELGTNAGEPAVAVNINYRFDQSELLNIKKVSDPEDFQEELEDALNSFKTRLVLYVENSAKIDYLQWLETYTATYPERAIESPQIKTILFPEEGEDQIIVFRFAYENNKETLNGMQSQVQTLVNSAVEFVESKQTSAEKYKGLYQFLSNLFDTYVYNATATPVYSLMINGVGDSKAFAYVYSALCRNAGLECITVTGTKDDETRYWNIIKYDGNYCHVDLQACIENREFRIIFSDNMPGYVWDASAYPACVAPEIPEITP